MTRRAGKGGRRLKRWGLLLLAAACAYGIGRGCDCADPERNRADQPAAAGPAAGAPGAATGTPPSRPGAPGAAAPGAAAAPKTPPLPARADQAEGRVVRIRDGDSIVVMRGGVGVEVRLDGIDCPELAQAFGKKAKSVASELAFGKTVRLVPKGKDRYGRELAEVFLPDGRSLNRALVSAGYAWWYSKYSTDQSLEYLEQGARAARRGLWADGSPVPPWEFRAQKPRRSAPPATSR
jgi:endonuclease YncB( thermonuclease family)